ncbi:MAG: FKBP-type peptidyl-prolyl cis-trans isomerase FkpA [Cyclobacteriaceae bacterium]|jgi:FKBP-type peptidyl-prolyl cis-trans isomerase FkpA
MKNLLLVLLVAVCIVGCSTESETVTESGLKITFIERGEDDTKLKSGYVTIMSAYYRTDLGQEIVRTAKAEPIYMLFDTMNTVQQNGLIQEVFNELHVGDSIYTEIPTKDLWEVSFKRPVPDSVGESVLVLVDIRVRQQMTIPEYRDYMTSLEKNKNAGGYEEARAELTNFLSENGIAAEASETGLQYVINNKTNGAYPEPGQRVSVKYKGMLLDGSVFDEGTYTFPLGQGEVIAGWDEGIGYLRVGESGVLYIPAEMGYGSRGSGARIPPFSPLMFEVELVEIQ